MMEVGVITVAVRRGTKCSSICLLLLSLLFLSGVCNRVFAADMTQATEIVSFDQSDLDGDSIPDLATISAIYMNENYRVSVFDQGDDMVWSSDWKIGTDFANDIWVFQTADDQTTKLIIRFDHDARGYVAELFDDVDTDGTVSYSIRNTHQIEINESSFPSVRMTASQPWILDDDTTNYAVCLSIFHPVYNILAISPPEVDRLPTDGRLAVMHEVVDQDSDGVPDYEVMQAFPDVPSDWGAFRTHINVNITDVQNSGFQDGFLWPYLGHVLPGSSPGSGVRRTPGDLTPPIHVDWQSGQVRNVAGFLPLWGADDRWLFMSTSPLTKGATNVLDFERFAYFNLSQDTVPNLVFRLVQSGLNDTVSVGSRVLYLQQVNFSWQQQSRSKLEWDFKLDVTGLHEAPSTEVPFKDFSLREVPFDDILKDFTARTWAYATFVAAESRNYESNEGIAEWTTLEGVQTDVSLRQSIPGSYQAQRDYLHGHADSSPASYYTDIREGFRGEYGDVNGPAGLYFSPIDRKLHLLKAQTGVWKLDETSQIRYGNLDGDPYIDQWIFTHVISGTQPLTVTSQLAVADSHLIYDGDDVVVIRQASVSPSLFEAVPPRNQEEWETLGDRLIALQPDFAPDDFLAMVGQFDGPEMQIHGAEVMEYRPISDGGFRFVLELTPEYRIVGPDLIRLDGLPPGKYIVENRNDAFSVRELTPPDLGITVPPMSLVGDQASQFQTSQIVFEVVNNGRQDASHVIITGEATDENGVGTIIGEQDISVASGAAEKISFEWAPNSPGTHTIAIRAAALGADGEGTLVHAEWTDTVSVDSAPSTSFHDGVSAFDLVPVTPILIFLGSLLFVSGVFLFYWWHVRQTV